MNYLIIVGVGFLFLLEKCWSSVHTYGPQFYGHELLYKEVILNKSSLIPVNYTHVFTYTDKEHEFVTSAKFQIDNFNSTTNVQYKNRTMEVTLNVFNATNFTAIASIYGFHQENISSTFIRKLYDVKRGKPQPLSFTLNFEYMQMEDEAL